MLLRLETGKQINSCLREQENKNGKYKQRQVHRTDMKHLSTRLKNWLRLSGILGVGVLWISLAEAHHSFAMFDMKKTLAIEGKVVEWAWVNPHSWLYLEVTREDGSVERWAFECSSPNMMIRWGWNHDDIQLGDIVTVDTHPAVNGDHVGSLYALFLPDGRVLADPMGRQVTGEQLATGLDEIALPTEPTGEAYK